MPAKTDRLAVSVPAKRTRAFASKVSSGCITCKIRHVKCDEGRPNCQKCVTTGRKCDGYLPTGQAKSQSRRSSVMNISLDPYMNRLLVLDISGTAQERNCFEFFRSCTITHLSTFDPSLWNQLVLQVSHRESAVRHAAIALGALHQSFLQDKSSVIRSTNNPHSDTFAMQQYTKALGLLVQPIRDRGKQAADVALMACVLFVCFETLRGHHGSALAHIESGVKIVAELTAEIECTRTSAMPLEVSKTPYVPFSMLNLVFVRLDNLASHLSTERDRKLLSPVLDDKERGYQAEIPFSFSSIEEARNSLDYVWPACFRILQKERFPVDVGDPTSTLDSSLNMARSVTLFRLRQWSRAFDNFFRQNPQDFDNFAQEHIHVMKLHRILIEIFFGIELAISQYETTWDTYYVEFKSMVEHAAEVVKLSNNPSSKLPRPVFSLDTGIILPLYLIASKCRHPVLRWKAITLLKSTPRQEGILNSSLTGRVVERLAELEEKDLGDIECAEDVPDWARLRGVAVRFDPDGRRAYLQYLRQENKESKRETIGEWLEW